MSCAQSRRSTTSPPSAPRRSASSGRASSASRPRCAARPATPDNAELRARLALVKGVLFFRLNDAYGARLWQEHRELKDLNLALHEAQSRWIRVERARKNVPANTGEFATRVAALKQRIDSLEMRLAATEQQQRDYLAQIAVHELEQQKDRLATYQIQARFALGSMYDRAASVPTPGRPSRAKVAAGRRGRRRLPRLAPTRRSQPPRRQK